MLLALSPVPALAQDEGAEIADILPLGIRIRDDIVVNALRGPQLPEETGLAITLIDANDIARKQFAVGF